jgi:hypothetical protein
MLEIFALLRDDPFLKIHQRKSVENTHEIPLFSVRYIMVLSENVITSLIFTSVMELFIIEHGTT